MTETGNRRARRGARPDTGASWTKWAIWSMWGAILVWLGLVGAAGKLAHDIWADDRAARATVAERTARELDRLSSDLAKITGTAEAATATLASNLTTGQIRGPLTGASVERALASTLKRFPELTALGVAFTPFAFDEARRLHAPMAVRDGDRIDLARLEEAYDYTQLYPWYGDALQKGRAWSPPRAREVATDQMAGEGADLAMTYSERLDLGGAEREAGDAAVLFAQVPLVRIGAAVSALDLGEHGYGLLISPSGQIMAHPDTRLVRDLIPVATAARTEGGYFKRLARHVHVPDSEGVTGRFRARSSVTGQPSTVTWRRLEGTGWLAAAVVSRQDLPLNQERRHYHMLLLVALLVAALVMLPLLDRLIRGALLGGWSWSLVTSLLLLAGIGVIWQMNITRPPSEVSRGDLVAGAGALHDMQERWLARAILARQDLPRFIPTGVFVQSVEFITANNVVLTGYVWQRFRDGPGNDLPQGFVMPEADTLDVEEAYRRTLDGETVVGWYFRVTLRQTFSYARYPLDWESVWIRLWPKTFDENVILVPDLDAYGLMNPSTLPGVERGMFIGGWTAVASYFDYRVNSYRTTFGVDEAGVIQGRPELYFSILIRRNFLDPFISNLTPIMLVLLLIFAMLMTVRREGRNLNLLGFSASTIITTCAALFFAVLISHIDLRTSLEAKQIFYLEYFYFITYGVILAVCVNSILFTREKRVRAIHYRDNLLPKLFYWPTVLAAMFGVTLLAFL